jgi:predicted nucleotidyltransferase
MINLRSTLRRKLLRYYFTNPKADHYLRELADLLKVDPANLSRELAGLVRQRIFLARTRGRQKYFRLNRDHPLYDEFRGIVFKTVGVVGLLREALGGLRSVKHAYLYGSFARDQEDPVSDIDVLVIGDTPAEKLEGTIRPLERKLRREINYTVMSPEEFKKRRAQKDAFLADVFRYKHIDLLTA